MPSRRNGVTRRALVAATVVGAGGSALAQRPPQPPRVKGPLVWLDMDQQDLDDAYDQLVYAPNRDYILKRCAPTASSPANASARPSASPMGQPRSRRSTSSPPRWRTLP